MTPEGRRQAQARLRLALELCALGEGLMRQRLRRDEPGASEEEIERRLFEWFRERPGAPLGDAPGRPVSWPRPRA